MKQILVSTYPPGERYKAHRPAETLNTAFKSTIILVIFYISVHYEPEDILYDRNENECDKHTELGAACILRIRKHVETYSADSNRYLVLPMNLCQHR